MVERVEAENPDIYDIGVESWNPPGSFTFRIHYRGLPDIQTLHYSFRGGLDPACGSLPAFLLFQMISRVHLCHYEKAVERKEVIGPRQLRSFQEVIAALSKLIDAQTQHPIQNIILPFTGKVI